MLETEEAVLRMMHLKVKGFLSKDIEVEDMHLALEAKRKKFNVKIELHLHYLL
jgi:two-component system invasion response regulator UvrY